VFGSWRVSLARSQDFPVYENVRTKWSVPNFAAGQPVNHELNENYENQTIIRGDGRIGLFRRP
jgi:hypothetical protein